MSEQQQDERDLHQSVHQEDSDEVEAHHHGGRSKAMSDEPRSDDESGDDFEAHMKKA